MKQTIHLRSEQNTRLLSSQILMEMIGKHYHTFCCKDKGLLQIMDGLYPSFCIHIFTFNLTYCSIRLSCMFGPYPIFQVWYLRVQDSMYAIKETLVRWDYVFYIYPWTLFLKGLEVMLLVDCHFWGLSQITTPNASLFVY